ncbi:MAG: hypothetical protein ACFFBC_11855, partial [Promethearchaeota archaeon]
MTLIKDTYIEFNDKFDQVNRFDKANILAAKILFQDFFLVFGHEYISESFEVIQTTFNLTYTLSLNINRIIFFLL